MAEHVTAEHGGVALGVLLPDVELEVGHARGVLLLEGEGTRPERVAHPTEHLLDGEGDDAPHAQGQSVAPAAPSAAPASTRRGGVLQHGRRRVQGRVDRPEVHQPDLVGLALPQLLAQASGDTDGAAPPDRGDSHAAPREARTLEIPPGWTHGMGRRRGEAHRPARHERQSAGDPRPLLDGHAVRCSQPDGIQPAGVVTAPRRHEGAVERAGERAPGLAPR